MDTHVDRNSDTHVDSHLDAYCYTYLVAVVHGELDEFAQADLDFIQRRVEERFGARLQDPSAPLLPRIQPLLEDCLLIRSPASGL